MMRLYPTLVNDSHGFLFFHISAGTAVRPILCGRSCFMHETQCQGQMWEIRHLTMLAIIRIGEPSRALTRNWSSGNSEGSSREFEARKIRLPGMYKIPRANKTFSSLNPQLGFLASEVIFVRCSIKTCLCHPHLSTFSRGPADGSIHAHFGS